jgi:hypothetical protein
MNTLVLDLERRRRAPRASAAPGVWYSRLNGTASAAAAYVADSTVTSSLNFGDVARTRVVRDNAASAYTHKGIHKKGADADSDDETEEAKKKKPTAADWKKDSDGDKKPDPVDGSDDNASGDDAPPKKKKKKNDD